MIDLSGGVPGITAGGPTTFADFWPFFVSQHLHPKTRATHALATLTYSAATITLVVGPRRRAIASIALLAGAAQVMSHRVFERNRAHDTDRVASPHVHWPLLADFLMVTNMLRGTIDRDVARIRDALGMSPDQLTLADAQITPLHIAA